MRLIDADALLTERKKSKYYHLPNGDIAIPIIDVEHAPTVQPERKEGAWINEGRIIRCNKCKIGYAAVKGMKSALTYNFCPNCGADMRRMGVRR